MPATVLDSYALVAFLREEPGSEMVRKILEKAAERDAPVHMTEVNYAEAQYIIRRKEGDMAWAAIARELPVMPIEFHPADRRLADVAAEFKSKYKLSLADAFSAALAKEKKAELVTGDTEFKALEKEVKIAWLH
jgi:predicted nucleic acid-binding protein